MARLERILDRANELGMVVILSLFYFGQDLNLADEFAVRTAVAQAMSWVLRKGYRNVMIEVANECDIEYHHPVILAPRIHELIDLVRIVNRAVKPEHPLLVGSSFSGGAVPSDNVVGASDFVLIHGNETNKEWLSRQIDLLRQRPSYRGQPIVNNEDDHFDFDQADNHMLTCIRKGVSWGYFDPGESNYRDGYQCPPIRWDLNTERKRQFFGMLKEITGV